MIETQKLIIEEGRKESTEEQMAKLRGVLDERTFDRMWRKGRSLSVEGAIEYALSGGTMEAVS